MFHREKRIIALLQGELPRLLLSVKDPGLSGFVTITGVELSKDRKTARVYFSVLGEAAQRESTTKALERAADYLWFQLKSRLSLKVVPRLEFHYDGSAERAQRIETILEKLESERDPHGESGCGLS